MKNYIFALFALITCEVASAEISSLAFPQATIELLPLSLAEIAKQTKPPLTICSDTGGWAVGQKAPARSKYFSKMPIVAPKDNMDPKVLKVPDQSVDYKLTVKAADVESAK